MADKQPLLELEEVTKSVAGSRHDGLSLHVDAGEIVALIGPTARLRPRVFNWSPGSTAQ